MSDDVSCRPKILLNLGFNQQATVVGKLSGNQH